MIVRFRRYIEEAPWEAEMERAFRLLDRFCWVAIALAALYFGPACLRIVLR